MCWICVYEWNFWLFFGIFQPDGQEVRTKNQLLLWVVKFAVVFLSSAASFFIVFGFRSSASENAFTHWRRSSWRRWGRMGRIGSWRTLKCVGSFWKNLTVLLYSLHFGWNFKIVLFYFVLIDSVWGRERRTTRSEDEELIFFGV